MTRRAPKGVFTIEVFSKFVNTNKIKFCYSIENNKEAAQNLVSADDASIEHIAELAQSKNPSRELKGSTVECK